MNEKRRAEELFNRAFRQLQAGRFEDAIVLYRDTLELMPEIPEAHFNLALALQELGRLEEAAAGYGDALTLKPDYLSARYKLGNTLYELGRPNEAAACYRHAIALKPDLPQAHGNLAIALLSVGDFAEGWREFEWRWESPDMADARRDFEQPQWRGDAGSGKILLIHAEQGFGDSLQFCRYAPLAAACGFRVILEVPRPLVRLLRSVGGVELVVEQGKELPAFDCHCPMMSLPLALGTTVETIPSAPFYLQADASLVTTWRKRLLQ